MGAKREQSRVDRIIGSLSELRHGELERIAAHIELLQKTALSSSSLRAEDPSRIPCAIFESSCSVFERIVLYLIDRCGMRYRDVAKLLHRSPSTIGVVYKNAKAKSATPLPALPLLEGPSINTDCFSPGLTVFEAAVLDLARQGLPVRAIADATARPYRTVWTELARARRKAGRTADPTGPHDPPHGAAHGTAPGGGAP